MMTGSGSVFKYRVMKT